MFSAIVAVMAIAPSLVVLEAVADPAVGAATTTRVTSVSPGSTSMNALWFTVLRPVVHSAA